MAANARNPAASAKLEQDAKELQWVTWVDEHEVWVRSGRAASGVGTQWSVCVTSGVHGGPLHLTRLTAQRLCPGESPTVVRPQVVGPGRAKWRTADAKAQGCHTVLRLFTASGSIELRYRDDELSPAGDGPGFRMTKEAQWKHGVRTRGVRRRITRDALTSQCVVQSEDVRRITAPAAGVLSRTRGGGWPLRDSSVRRDDELLQLVLTRPVSFSETTRWAPWHAMKEARRSDVVTTVTLRSPVNGRVGKLTVHPGKVVAPLAPVVVVEGDSQLSCWIALSRSEAQRLRAPTVVLRDADGARSVVATPSRAAHDPTVLKLNLTTWGQQWHIGEAVPASVEDGVGEPELVTPNQALLKAGNEAYCFVQLGPARFERRVITLGRKSVDGSVVRRGLSAGERVVIDGIDAVRAALARQRGAR